MSRDESGAKAADVSGIVFCRSLEDEMRYFSILERRAVVSKFQLIVSEVDLDFQLLLRRSCSAGILDQLPAG